MRDQFASERFWVNLSRTMLSYPMLIMQRTSFTSIIVYLDAVVNPAEYQYELWNDWGTRTERLENFFIKRDVSSMDESAIAVAYEQAPSEGGKKFGDRKRDSVSEASGSVNPHSLVTRPLSARLAHPRLHSASSL